MGCFFKQVKTRNVTFPEFHFECHKKPPECGEPNGSGQNTRKEESDLLNREVPLVDNHAESVSVVLIARATASHSTLINEEIIKSIILNSAGPFTGKAGKKKRADS